MSIEQINIYEYINVKDDPLYQSLKALKKGENIEMNNMTINYNDYGLYQVIAADMEQPFSSLEECYYFISNNVSMP